MRLRFLWYCTEWIWNQFMCDVTHKCDCDYRSRTIWTAWLTSTEPIYYRSHICKNHTVWRSLKARSRLAPMSAFAFVENKRGDSKVILILSLWAHLQLVILWIDQDMQPSPILHKLHHWFMLCTLGQYIVNMQWGRTSNGCLTVFTFGIWKSKYKEWVLCPFSFITVHKRSCRKLMF